MVKIGSYYLVQLNESAWLDIPMIRKLYVTVNVESFFLLPCRGVCTLRCVIVLAEGILL